MSKIKKAYNFKIMSALISIIFLCNTTLYSYFLPEHSLRVPVQKDTSDRANMAIQSVTETGKNDTNIQRAFGILDALRGLEGMEGEDAFEPGEIFYVGGEEVTYIESGEFVRVYAISGFPSLVFKVFKGDVKNSVNHYAREKGRMQRIERHLGAMVKRIKIDSFWLTVIPKTAAYAYSEGFIIEEKVEQDWSHLSDEELREQRHAISQFYEDNGIIDAEIKKQGDFSGYGIRVNKTIGPAELVNIDFTLLRLRSELRMRSDSKMKGPINWLNMVRRRL